MSFFYQKLLKFLEKQNDEEEEQKININGSNVQRHSNAVITSKYTVFNFLFLNLYEQFHKTSNIYFLFIGILQTIPDFSSTNGIPTVALPLSIVLIANAIKDAYEDWKRHVSDKVENNKICYVIPTKDSHEIDNADFHSTGIFGRIKNCFKRKCKKKINVVDDNKTKIDISNHVGGEDNNYSSDERYSVEYQDGYFYNFEEEEQCEFIEGTIQKQWKNIEVGDIILCNKSDFFCADILLLGTSDKNGIAFVETSSLDGETNLKVKQTNGYIMNLLGCDRAEAIERVKKLKGFIISDMPNKELSTMYGTIYLVKEVDTKLNEIQFSRNFKQSIDGQASEINSMLEDEENVVEDMVNINVKSRKEQKGKRKRKKEQRESHTRRLNLQNNLGYKKIPFDAKQFLLRGCKLKNTDWIIGIVIYTGKKTKIQMNSTEAIRKTSKLERLTNKMTIIIWVIQMTICLISAIYNVAILYSSKRNDFSYLPFSLEKRKPLIVVGVISFFSWMVITGNLVPISLVVTMSFVKVIQAYFISCDETMIHRVCTNPCEEIGESKRKSVIYEKKSLLKKISDIRHSLEDIEIEDELISNVKRKEERLKKETVLSKGRVMGKRALEKRKESVNLTNKENLDVNDDSTVGIKKENKSKHGNYIKHDLSVNSFSFMEKKNNYAMTSFMEGKEKNYIYFNAVPRTSSLIEELGQIEYIFSDKTGTLTCNFMEFRKCAVNGISYGKGLTEIKRNILKKKNVKVPPEPVLPAYMRTPHVNIVDDDLVSHLKNINHFNHAHLMYFFIHLAINHAVICEKNENGEDTYASSSPDEEAFVYAAKHLGIQFLYRRDGKYGIKIFGKVYEIETLASVEFTSQRKMSSIVCRIPCFSCGRECRQEICESNKSSTVETSAVETTVRTDINNKTTWNRAYHSSTVLNAEIKEDGNSNTYGRSINGNSTHHNTDRSENLQDHDNINKPSEQNVVEKDSSDSKKKRERSKKEKKKGVSLDSKKKIIKEDEAKKKIQKICIDGDSPLRESMVSQWQKKSRKKEKTKRDEEWKCRNLKQKKKKHESARHLREKERTSDFNDTYKDKEIDRRTAFVCSNPSKHSKIIIFCKGAGSVILKKLEKTTEIDKLTVKHMEAYADEGLRTLCIAKREISEEEFAKWYEVYKTASCSVKDRDEKIEKAADMIENNLTLQGVTGIEDKLQEGVSSTIEDLRIAGIHIWMLTGDKIETAINIGIAANLIDHYAEQFVYTEDLVFDEKKLMNKLNEDILKIEKALAIPHYEFEIDDDDDEDVANKSSNKKEQKGKENKKEKERGSNKDPTRNKNRLQPQKGEWKNKCKLCNKPQPLSLNRDKFTSIMNYTNHVLIVDGTVIDILLTEKFERQFFYLADKCISVVCGRISPYQKGAIVSAANRLLKKITLAIGDGANDRNMINQANIGIGIRGLEGVQAFNASDYGIGQFRFLKTLLLVHGRLSYRRISKLVVYMFYKNIVLILPLFYFGFISLYSGQKFYYEFLMQTYNVFFTSIPVIIYAILDQDIDIKISLVKPVLYRLGIYHYYFNIKIFIAWILNSIFHSLVVYLLPLYFLSYYNIPNTDGTPYDLWEVGCATFFLTVLVVNLKMLLESYYLNALPIIGVLLSILCFVILFITFSFMRLGSSQMLGAAAYLSTSIRFWLVMILGIMIALTRDYVFKVYKRNFNPEIYHLLQKHCSDFVNPLWSEQEKDQNPKKTISEKLRTFGYAFSEADPACIDVIRQQDKLI